MMAAAKSAGAIGLCAAMLAMACGGEARDPLSVDDEIAGWANSASAVGVFSHGYDPLAFADGHFGFEDPNCPETSDDGTTVTIVGGCETSTGTKWVGSATVVRDGGDRLLTFAEYGRASDLAYVTTTTGVFDVTELTTEEHHFLVNTYQEGTVVTSTDYSGSVAGGYQGATEWNGSGTIIKEGIPAAGQIEATTTGQRIDDATCSGQSLSGTTSMTSPAHTVIITYDGASDCDADHAARWSRDGIDQGLVEGVVCAIHAPGAASARANPTGILLLILACLGFTWWWRRPPGCESQSR